MSVARFQFIADALNASGGFRPQVRYETDESGLYKPASVQGAPYLVPYPRESARKFAARCATSVYENHLREACERFVGYLAKRPPVRNGADGPLAARFVADADWCGNSLDIFWQAFALDAKARGSMLVLIDMPAETPGNLEEQVERRAIPYLTAIAPERLQDYRLDEFGRFAWVKLPAIEIINGNPVEVVRYWDHREWKVLRGEEVLRSGAHPFGECPMLAFTEAGQFPHLGSFEQVADLSRRMYNARSELDEILRAQTFSLLTYQVLPEYASQFNGTQVAAEIGTNNMLIHQGEAPSFIAPPDGPASTYITYIDSLQQAIRRLSFTIEEPDKASAESGVALTIRFQALNAALSRFARRMEDLERRVWLLFGRAIRAASRVEVSWPSDFSFADVGRELDVLTSMQMTGFPEEVLREKRKLIVAADMATLEDDVKNELMTAIGEGGAELPVDPPAQSGGQQ